MTVKCAIWLRVSSGGQNEQNQEPDVLRWAESHGYEIVRTFRLHDVSAWHGEQEQAQLQAIEAIRAGEFTVLVGWVGDRIERRGVESLLSFMRRVREVGGRVECSNDPLLNSFEHLGDLGPALAAWMAETESRRKSDRARIAIEASAAAGSHRGRAAWGYTIEGAAKFERRLVPTADGLHYVPLIYSKAVEGWSLGAIAAWLDEQGVKPVGIKSERTTRGKGGKWHPRSVRSLLANPVYAGESSDGREVEALVTWEVWRQAQAALSARSKRGQLSVADPKWLSGEAALCAMCGGPMNKKGDAAHKYLRCERRGRDDPQRRPCTTPANMVNFEAAVRLADGVLSGLGDYVYEQTVVEGNADLRREMLADIERRARAAARLPFDQMMPVMRGLEAEREAIPAETTGSRENHLVLKDDGEALTYGDLWQAMGIVARRDFLTDEVFVSFLNLEHAEAAATVERLGPPDVVEGKTAMWWMYATEPVEVE